MGSEPEGGAAFVDVLTKVPDPGGWFPFDAVGSALLLVSQYVFFRLWGLRTRPVSGDTLPAWRRAAFRLTIPFARPVAGRWRSFFCSTSATHPSITSRVGLSRTPKAMTGMSQDRAQTTAFCQATIRHTVHSFGHDS